MDQIFTFFSEAGYHFTYEQILLLLAVGLVAGFIDSIAGGGGLITVPALLLTGLSPVQVLATNKLQGLCGSGSSTIAYARKGHVNPKAMKLAFILSLIGAALGAVFAAYIPALWLEIALPPLLVVIAIYFALKPDPGELERKRLMPPLAFQLIFIFGIGFYDGLFGPGTGSFFMLAYVSLAGYGLLKATAHTKLVNFASNIGALGLFAMLGGVVWKIGLLMGVGQFIGAQLGAKLAMKNGARIIRPLLVVICLAICIKLITQDQHPLMTLLYKLIF